MLNQERVSGEVSQYLQSEFESGDPKRAEAAQQAMKANEEYGIGGWFQTGKRIIRLGRQKPARISQRKTQ